MLYSLSGVFFIFIAFLFLSNSASAAPCHTLYSSPAVPLYFGASYNVFSGKHELLLNADCCGDGNCNKGETCLTCPFDCICVTNPVYIDPNFTGTNGAGSHSDLSLANAWAWDEIDSNTTITAGDGVYFHDPFTVDLDSNNDLDIAQSGSATGGYIIFDASNSSGIKITYTSAGVHIFNTDKSSAAYDDIMWRSGPGNFSADSQSISEFEGKYPASASNNKEDTDPGFKSSTELWPHSASDPMVEAGVALIGSPHNTLPMYDQLIDPDTSDFTVFPPVVNTVTQGTNWNIGAYTQAGPGPTDTTFPQVNAMTVTLGSATINWNVSDSGGSHLSRIGVWRAPEVSGSPGTWQRLNSLTQNIANQNRDTYTSTAVDNPAPNTYWYGIHVVDQDGNCAIEQNRGCNPPHAQKPGGSHGPGSISVSDNPDGPIDPQATAETKALYNNLKSIARDPTKVIFGHHSTTWHTISADQNINTSDPKNMTGSHSALVGTDYSWTEWTPVAMKNHIEATYNRGGVNEMIWSARNPVTGGFFNDNTPAVPDIIPGGSRHDDYKIILDGLADFVMSLRGSDGNLVPVIFRPYHEHNGSWFWWGRNHCTVSEFKTLWQFTVEYLRHTKNVHNLLYAYSPDKWHLNTDADYLERYPGDSYVDVLGVDVYYYTGSSKVITNTRRVVRLAEERDKIPAITESGHTGGLVPYTGTTWFTQSFMNPIKNDTSANRIAYVQFWRNTEINVYYVPYPGEKNEADFMIFFNDPFTLFEDDLPNMYTYP